MTVPFSRFTGFVLALTIAVTSVTMAMARGQTRDAAGVIIICSGAGVVQLQVDREGNPVGPVHICPDCALGALDIADAPVIRLMPERAQFSLSFVIEPVSLTGVTLSEARARGPPPV